MDDLATGREPDDALPPVVSAQEWEAGVGEGLRRAVGRGEGADPGPETR